MSAFGVSHFANGRPNPVAASAPLRPWLARPEATLEDIFAGLEHGPASSGVIRHEPRNLFGARVQVSETHGSGAYELTSLGKDIFLLVVDAALKESSYDVIPADDLIQFYFKLSGDTTLTLGDDQSLRMQRPGLLVFNRPAGAHLQESIAARARERGVAITVRPQYLIEHFLDGGRDAASQLRTLVNLESDGARHVQLRLSSHMYQLADLLIENPYTQPGLRLLHAEALVVQLLCAAVKGFADLGDDPKPDFSEREVRCLHAARSVLMKQFRPVPTIRQIARMVGINETSLKRGFRSVFGETPYEFSLRCRMEQAMTLLQEGRESVALVSETVGYSHQTSFATAFRQHFQISPREVRPLKPR